MVSATDFIRVTYNEPHTARRRQMLAAHPELRTLAGHTPSTALWITGLVIIQGFLAVAVGDRSWLVWLPCAYIVGATIDHALWALIHDVRTPGVRSRTATDHLDRRQSAARDACRRLIQQPICSTTAIWRHGLTPASRTDGSQARRPIRNRKTLWSGNFRSRASSGPGLRVRFLTDGPSSTW